MHCKEEGKSLFLFPAVQLDKVAKLGAGFFPTRLEGEHFLSTLATGKFLGLGMTIG